MWDTAKVAKYQTNSKFQQGKKDKGQNTSKQFYSKK